MRAVKAVRRLAAGAAMAVAGLSLLASDAPIAGGLPAPEPIRGEDLRWISPPVAGLSFAWVLGSEQVEGLYAIKVRLASGSVIPPHTHPDERYSTVLSGTLYVGFGAEVDHGAVVAVEAGETYVAPAGLPHYLIAADGDVVYQESGHGPTATRLVTP